MTNDNIMPYAYVTKMNREIANALNSQAGAYKTQTPVAIKTMQNSAPTYARMQKGD